MRLLKKELDLAMALSGKAKRKWYILRNGVVSIILEIQGCSTIMDIDRSLVVHQSFFSNM